MSDQNNQKEGSHQGRASPEKGWLDVIAPQNAEHQKMLEWLESVKFKRAFVNGVDEQDVWKKLDELNRMYEASMIAERARYETLLKDATDSVQTELKKYKLAVKTMKAHYDELVQMNYDLVQQVNRLSGQEGDRAQSQETEPHLADEQMQCQKSEQELNEDRLKNQNSEPEQKEKPLQSQKPEPDQSGDQVQCQNAEQGQDQEQDHKQNLNQNRMPESDQRNVESNQETCEG